MISALFCEILDVVELGTLYSKLCNNHELNTSGTMELYQQLFQFNVIYLSRPSHISSQMQRPQLGASFTVLILLPFSKATKNLTKPATRKIPSASKGVVFGPNKNALKRIWRLRILGRSFGWRSVVIHGSGRSEEGCERCQRWGPRWDHHWDLFGKNPGKKASKRWMFSEIRGLIYLYK